jgi:hypothetical protein
VAKTISYTKRPVTIEAMKVPRIAKVIMAPKFEKNGFCKNTSQVRNPYYGSVDTVKVSIMSYKCENSPVLG